jgi:tripartite-type tricarboxylate transporter receptor subunit TctC
MLKRRSALVLFIGALAALLLAAAPSSAQTWPTRPVRFIIPLGPGAGVDIVARMFAEKLSAKWGQPVVVENKPGGDAIVAINTMINARDDHVLLFSPASAFTGHPLLYQKMPYDPKALVPIARVTSTIIAVAVPTALGVNNMKEFVAKLRAEPGKLNFASATGANDLLFQAWLKTENLQMARVPYKDTVQAINDLAENRVQGYIAAYAIMRPQVLAGKVKMLALTSNERAAVLPDIPPAKEAGYPDLTFEGLIGLFGPREMTQALRERVAKDVVEVAADPIIKQRLGPIGQVLAAGNAADFEAALAAQHQTIVRIGKALGVALAN